MTTFLFLHESPFEYTGVLSLCGYLASEGHEVDVLIKSEEGKHFWDKVKDFKPDWVGFSSIISQQHGCYRLAREVKEKLGIGTVFGGPYTSYKPDVIEREEIDVIIRGEAEEALLDFLDTHDRGEDYVNLPNVWTKRNGEIIANKPRPLEPDLDKYPIPDRQYYYKYPYLRNTLEKQFMTGRGCPYNCYFCFNSEFRKLYEIVGHGVRRNSPERAIEEIAICKANYPLKQLCFNDDIFPIHVDWLEKFLPRYKKEIGVPFSCQVSVNMVKEDVARLLGENCCSHVMIGLESGNPRVRREILGKKFTNEQFITACERLHKYGIKIKSYNIVGSPTETLEEVFDTMELNSRARADLPWFTLFHPMPGSRTEAIAKEYGYLDEDFSQDELSFSIFRGSLLNQPEIKEVQRAHKLFYIGARNHRWIPLIRKIVKLRLGPFYHMVFFLTYFIRFSRESRFNLLNVIKAGWKNLRNY